MNFTKMALKFLLFNFLWLGQQTIGSDFNGVFNGVRTKCCQCQVCESCNNCEDCLRSGCCYFCSQHSYCQGCNIEGCCINTLESKVCKFCAGQAERYKSAILRGDWPVAYEYLLELPSLMKLTIVGVKGYRTLEALIVDPQDASSPRSEIVQEIFQDENYWLPWLNIILLNLQEKSQYFVDFHISLLIDLLKPVAEPFGLELRGIDNDLLRRLRLFSSRSIIGSISNNLDVNENIYCQHKKSKQGLKIHLFKKKKKPGQINNIELVVSQIVEVLNSISFRKRLIVSESR